MERTSVEVDHGSLLNAFPERPGLEERIRRTERMLDALLGSLPLPIITYDRSGYVILWNAAAERLYGWSAQEVLGEPDPGIPPASQQSFAAILRRVMQDETLPDVEVGRRAKDGRQTDVLATYTPLRDASGIITGMVCTVTDASGRYRADRVLRESEDRLRAMNVGVLVYGPQGNLIASNPAARRLFGRSRHGLAAMATMDSDIFVREDGTPWPIEDWPVSRVAATQQPEYDVVLGIRGPETTDVRWVLASTVPDFDVRGSLSRITCTFTDITDRKRIEDALRASEKRFRTIFDHAPVGIMLTDREGCLLQTNETLRSLLGYTADELSGKYWAMLQHPEDVDLEMQLDEELVEGARDLYYLESRLIRKDGQEVWTRMTATEVRADDGEPLFAIGMVEDISERRVFEEQLRHQALHDALSGLPNRTLLADRLDRAIADACREDGDVAFLLMDLNHFKDVNDTFGHSYGDVLVRDVAARLCCAVRERDTVARLGGDEFGIVLPATDVVGAIETADRLLATLEQPFDHNGQRVDLGGSIGIAMYPTHGAVSSDLLRRADVAMYVAKRSNSGRRVYESEHDEYSSERLQIVGELRRAVSQGQLRLYYQPKQSLAGGTVKRVEALLRWEHPERGMILPDQFIPLAERTGIIRPLTLWVFNEGLRQCHEWREMGIDVAVEMNLSARSLHDLDLFDQIEDLLKTWEIPPDRVGLEITESAVMADPKRALSTLDRLHHSGVSISVDDFGTGYSSLAYLQRLPVDVIKIDRSFVHDMVRNENDCHIVQATISLGHDLGLKVVAEGVEDRETADRLQQFGCDVIQGYFLSPPLPASEATEWLHAAQE